MAKIAISVCGGGALGLGPLQFMCRLEQDLGKKLTNQSIAFAGTSTGAIIAACLAEGMSAHDIFDLYKNHLKKIFTKYSLVKRLKPSCPTYDNSNLKKMLQDHLKGKMSDWKKPVFIPVTCMNGKSVEKVWDTDDKEAKWFCTLTSTAAPTYFDVIEKDGLSYCDGGLHANDPIMCLQAGLKKEHPNTKYKILSFNTGMDIPNTDKGNKSLVGWGEYILDNWVARSGMSNYFEACANLGEKNIFRASPSIEKPIKMDDVSDKTLNKVIEVWDKYYDSVRTKILKFMKD